MPIPDTRAPLERLYLEAFRAGVNAASEHLRFAGSAADRASAVYLDTVRDELMADARDTIADEYSWTDLSSPLARALTAISSSEERGEGEDPTAWLAEENRRLKVAGDALAVAALRVTTEYDGVHRLRLAVADWSKATADEGGRAKRETGQLVKHGGCDCESARIRNSAPSSPAPAQEPEGMAAALEKIQGRTSRWSDEDPDTCSREERVLHEVYGIARDVLIPAASIREPTRLDIYLDGVLVAANHEVGPRASAVGYSIVSQHGRPAPPVAQGAERFIDALGVLERVRDATSRWGDEGSDPRTPEDECPCRRCVEERERDIPLLDQFPTFIVCPDCRNKRCPHATDHRHACTDSNEPDQPGSIFGGLDAALATPSAPQGLPREEERNAWLKEYERRKLALTDAVWTCADEWNDEDQLLREHRGREQDRAEKALDAHIAALARPVVGSEERPCGICGGWQTEIRPRHPGEPRRVVCPTCIADRLARIHEQSSPHYGVASAALRGEERT